MRHSHSGWLVSTPFDARRRFAVGDQLTPDYPRRKIRMFDLTDNRTHGKGIQKRLKRAHLSWESGSDPWEKKKVRLAGWKGWLKKTKGNL